MKLFSIIVSTVLFFYSITAADLSNYYSYLCYYKDEGSYCIVPGLEQTICSTRDGGFLLTGCDRKGKINCRACSVPRLIGYKKIAEQFVRRWCNYKGGVVGNYNSDISTCAQDDIIFSDIYPN